MNANRLKGAAAGKNSNDLDMVARKTVFGTTIAAATMLGAAAALADGDVVNSSDTGTFFYDFDKVSLHRDMAGIDWYEAGQTAVQEDADAKDGLVFPGGGVNLWYPGGAGGYDVGIREVPEDVAPRVQIGMDWRPDLGVSGEPSPRTTVRYLAGSEADRVGLRADLTALLYDGTDPSRTTAWRITGMLGSTSVSLAPEATLPALGGDGNDGGITWDIGVGWSSGPVSLNAAYLSSYREEDGLVTDVATLSFGADYSVLPGLSFYGELNVVGDAELFGEERPGTVVILGTGLSF